MYTKRNQHSIVTPVSVEGFGYWSGCDVRVEFRPAPPGSGIVFVRADIKGSPRIPAAVAFRSDAQRRTNLRAHGAGVDMIEHVMAALAGLQIDNCEVWVTETEMPGCDGSALPFVRALEKARIVEQPAPRAQFVVRQAVRLGDDEHWIEARPCCSGKTVLQYELDYGSQPGVGQQSLEVVLSPESFRSQLASARTFTFQAEAEAMRKRGIGQRATYADLLVFGANGPIENRLRFPDECVRHKLLDMVGDLAMAGVDLIGRFIAYRSGHQLNAEMVQTLLAQRKAHGLKRCA